MNNTEVLGLDHVSLLVADAEKALQFYQQLLGLQTLPRPALGFAGYWLDLGQGHSIHLMELDNPYQAITRPGHGGRDQHFALRVRDLEVFQVKLVAMQVEFTLSKSGRPALFFRDPDQNAIELYQLDN